MKILVTGSSGFIGKNLIAELKNRGYDSILAYDKRSTAEQLDAYTKECDFVFHLAGVNRPKDEKEFMEGNFGFTSTLLEYLKKHKNKTPILATSSIQAQLENPYGKSKKAGEDLLLSYKQDTEVSVFIYRLPNVFGKWCKPNYNSVVATFCHNIANELPINISSREKAINLVYIDDVVKYFISELERFMDKEGDNLVRDDKLNFYQVDPTYTRTLGEVVDLIYSFKESRISLQIPNLADPFIKKLYSTYTSYLPTDKFSYPLKMNFDQRGSFTEFIKTIQFGQVSINVSKPGIKKGDHWHHTKIEKFLVVSGRGIIRFRNADMESVIEYPVSSDKLEVIDIPVGYIHNITNTGDSDMVTIMWSNELYDPLNPDTYRMEI